MPRKPKHPCGYPGCPELTDRQYCPAHQKLVTSRYNRHGRTPEMKKRYNGAWPAIRRRFIAAHPLCEMCLREGRATAAEEVHHIVPLADGGTHHLRRVPFDRIRRITGYLVGTLDRFNNGKRAEERDRVKHGMGGNGCE